MDKLKALWKAVVDILDPAGDWIVLLPIRLLMAYEFFRAGQMKFSGSNWFGNVQDNFPFPFNIVPVEISWFLATWTELIGGLFLFFGLFTRPSVRCAENFLFSFSKPRASSSLSTLSAICSITEQFLSIPTHTILGASSLGKQPTLKRLRSKGS